MHHDQFAVGGGTDVELEHIRALLDRECVGIVGVLGCGGRRAAVGDHLGPPGGRLHAPYGSRARHANCWPAVTFV